MSKMLNYKNKFMANSTLDLIPNDISWLKNSTKLIESKFIKYQSIQIYHPKNSSNFGESDQRLLDFKDFYKFENKKCFDAVLFYSECLRNIIPSNKKIYLCCVPSSKAYTKNTLAYLIGKLSAGTIIDGSELLVTIKNRPEKKKNYKFTNEELASTINVKGKYIPKDYQILLLDDVVTTGQSFDVCKKLIVEAGFNNQITCLALGYTARNWHPKTLADEVQVTNSSIEPINKSDYQRTPPKVTSGRFDDLKPNKLEIHEDDISNELKGKALLEKISGLSSSNIDEIVIKCGYIKRKDNYGNAYPDFKKFNAALSIANEKRYKYEEESEKTFEVKSKKLPKKVDDFKNYIKKKQIKENVKKKVKSFSSKIMNFLKND
tara:strand:+ start:178 stop:1305 length:1128 start_codon:yes stop_codon:yes gene_type:complete